MPGLDKGAFATLIAITLLQFSPALWGEQHCEEAVGSFASLEGSVEIQISTQANWREARLGGSLCEGDSVRVGALSRAAIALINDVVLRLDQNTTMRLVDVSAETEERSWIDIIKGVIQSFSRQPRRLSINSPYLNGSIEGTEFVVRADRDGGSILVLEGTVVASNTHGSVPVAAGEVAEAAAGSAPTLRTLIRPRDAVQWSLYYPPLLAVAGEPVPDDADPALRSALEQASRGDTAAALAALNDVPEAARNIVYQVYRAALLSSAGRAYEARSALDEAIRQDPNAALAYAQRSVLNLIQNQRGKALADAEQAASLSNAAAVAIALSYAQQANFDIDAARQTLIAAVEQQPDAALAWARLGELWLMTGEPERAREAAARATALAPDLARTQLVLGFSALAGFRSDEARAAFERAIQLSSADPLAHLGLGLSMISDGHLADGRKELEVAVSLDSNQALLRAYLGKAYFEEKRFPLDAQQYSVAKSLDPMDPTAWLYDGILKQTVNRPVEAVQDLQKSIELNDNRAVYRSRLLLDKDRAARATSLARAYQDLGFAQLGINQASSSIAVDPANASAHRFLSDSYRNVRRREIARVSELLQAQLLQDININPVQPSISETNLNIVTAGGPASAGFNEFTPLFQRNQAQLSATAYAGSNDTRGAEGVVSALYDRYSISLGAMTYTTDGWRDNNDLEQTLYNAFFQAAVTDTLNVQAEYQHRDSEEGDLAFNFDPDDFSDDKTVDRDRDSLRLGVRYSPATDSHFLLSYIHSDRDEKLRQTEELPPIVVLPPIASTRSKVTEDSDQVEMQYIKHAMRSNFVVGAGYSHSNRRDKDDISIDDPVLGNLLSVSDSVKTDIEQPNGYVYANVEPVEPVTLTLGASYGRYEEEDIDNENFNPKLGIQWNINNALRLRAAAFKVVKPAVVNNRTIEPTQVAGFNQFFDDINGTESRRLGTALDWQPIADLAVGGEATWRELDEPVFIIGDDSRFEERKERYHRLYLNWTPSDRLAVNSELRYDRYTSESGISTEFENLPERVETVSVPLGVTYFSPAGVFSGVSATYVDQEVRRSATATQASGKDSFTTVDGAVGYRFGKRRGVISLEARNIFDKEFEYQDDSYREFRDEPAIGPYFPDRTIMVRLMFGL